MPDLSVPLHEAVKRLVDLLPLDDVNWALTGSVAHRLQGVDVECRDVDVQTDERSAYEAEDRLADWLVERVALRSSASIDSHFGRFRFDDLDLDIEVMGALRKRRRDGSWTEATNPADHRAILVLGDLHVPVMTLAYEAHAYELIGRLERAALLRASL